MSDLQQKNPQVYDRIQKTVSLCLRAKVEGDATPADKKHESDLPGVAVLISEGKTADADAIEASLPYQTPSDLNGQYSILLKGSELDEIEDVQEARLIESRDGGSTTVSLVTSGSTVRGLTPEGNILIDVDATDALNSTDDSEIVLEVKFRRK